VGILASDYGLSAGKGLVNDGTGKLVLDAAYFGTVSGSTSVQATVSGHGQFVYNTTTRALMWDADGAGTASSGIALAVFNSGAVLRAGNFAITTGTVNQASTAVALPSTVNQASTAVALSSTVNQASTAVARPSTVNQAPTAVALSNNVTSIIPLTLLALCIAYLLIAPRRLAQGEQRQRRSRPYSVILPFRRK
jgi:hypothetical protein